MANSLRTEIVDAMARTYFVSAFADLQDRLREEGRRYVDPGPGGDWMDIAPKTPRDARVFAQTVAKSIEAHYGTSLDRIYEIAVSTPGTRYGNRQSPDNFGYGIAMQSVGHGVSWFDDNPEFSVNGKRFQTPSAEFHLDKYRGRYHVMASGPSWRFARE